MRLCLPYNLVGQVVLVGNQPMLIPSWRKTIGGFVSVHVSFKAGLVLTVTALRGRHVHWVSQTKSHVRKYSWLGSPKLTQKHEEAGNLKGEGWQRAEGGTKQMCNEQAPAVVRWGLILPGVSWDAEPHSGCFTKGGEAGPFTFLSHSWGENPKWGLCFLKWSLPTYTTHACVLAHGWKRTAVPIPGMSTHSAGGDKDRWGRWDGHWSPCLLQSLKCSFLAMLIERVCSYTSQVCAFLNLAYFNPCLYSCPFTRPQYGLQKAMLPFI